MAEWVTLKLSDGTRYQRQIASLSDGQIDIAEEQGLARAAFDLAKTHHIDDSQLQQATVELCSQHSLNIGGSFGSPAKKSFGGLEFINRFGELRQIPKQSQHTFETTPTYCTETQPIPVSADYSERYSFSLNVPTRGHFVRFSVRPLAHEVHDNIAYTLYEARTETGSYQIMRRPVGDAGQYEVLDDNQNWLSLTQATEALYLKNPAIARGAKLAWRK